MRDTAPGPASAAQATDSLTDGPANAGHGPGHTAPDAAPPGGLILIGDPKQAIYGFRGGDVFAYLDAAADAHGRYGMDTNYRSSPAVIRGIGALFEAGGADAFVLEGIDFRPVQAGRAAGDRRIEQGGHELPGVTAWAAPAEAGTAKGDLQHRIRAATVRRVADLLDEGAVVTDGGRRAVHPSEIAVLVNTNHDALAMQGALDAAGVPAVCIHQDSVFTHTAARDLLRVLRAAAAPFDAERLRVALTTAVFGYRMGDLVALDADDRAWSEATERFQEAHVRWAQRGVQAMLEPLLQDAAARIVGLTDGDRRMTDCLHVADLLQRAEHEVFGMAGLVHWLEEAIRRADAGEVSDADRVRLADDSALVQVTTVHKAKGLQWPVVFVPDAPWLGTGGGDPTSPPLAFHDARNRAVIDLGSRDADVHRPQAVRERRAEQVRSLYVALTRAEQACFFVHAAANNAVDGPLAWLLHPAGDDGAGVRADEWLGGRKLPEWFDAEAATARLHDLEHASSGCLRVEPLPEPERVARTRPATAATAIGGARKDFPAPWAPWSVLSYSRLAGRIAGHAEPAAGADDEGGGGALPLATVEAGTTPEEVPTHPRGAGFGRAFHEVLEAARFDGWPAPGADIGPAERELVAARLRRNGVATTDEDGESTPVRHTATMIAGTLHAPLPTIGPLSAIPASRRRAELEFFIRLGGARLETLLARIAEAGYPGARMGGAAPALRGLMHGFVDLVVEHDGAYWILDYKTNLLGPRRADYAPGPLAEAIAAHHYDLQYLIYTVALHRHLRQRLPDYDPRRHLGGVLYLFVRGLDESGAQGVFADRPDPAFIEALDALLDGEAAA